MANMNVGRKWFERKKGERKRRNEEKVILRV